MMSIKNIIIQSFQILKRDFTIWLGFIFCEIGVTLLGYALKMSSSIFSFFVDKGFHVFIIGTVLLFLFALLSLLGFWVNITLIRVVTKRIKGEQTKTFLEELHEAFHLVARMLGALLLFNFFVFLPIAVSLFGFSSILFGNLFFGKNLGDVSIYIFAILGLYGIFHAFYFSIKYGFVPFIVAIEGQHIRQSFHISAELVKNRFLEVFFHFVGSLFVYVLIFFFIDSLFRSIISFFNNIVVTYLINGLSLFVSGFFPVLVVSSLFFIYDELKKTRALPEEAKK